MNLAMKTMALAGVFCLCAATPLFAQTHTLQVRKQATAAAACATAGPPATVPASRLPAVTPAWRRFSMARPCC